MNNKSFMSSVWKFVDANAPALATGGSLIGLGLSLFFAYKAAKNAAAEQEKYEARIEEIEQEVKEEKITEEEAKEEKTRAKIGHVASNVLIYRFSLLSGIGSGFLAILSNWLSSKTILGLTTLAIASGDKLKIAMDKAKELIGEDKFQKFQESIDKEFVVDRAKNQKNIKPEVSSIIVGSGVNDDDKETVWDTYTGYPFRIHPGILKDAIAQGMALSQLDFGTWRGMLGLYGPCMMGNDLTWTASNPFHAEIKCIKIPNENGEDRIIKALYYKNKPKENRFSK